MKVRPVPAVNTLEVRADEAGAAEARAAALETVIARLVAEQAAGRIGYWAAHVDERGISHFAYTLDSAYADLSPENAASRSAAAVAFGRAIDRYRAALALLR